MQSARPVPAATILIVDDEPQNCRLLQTLLGPEGYRTRIATNGADALASIAQHAPDLILLDIMMPGMDGCKVAKALKADPATSSIPIIIITQRTDRDAHLAGLDAGAEEFLMKPVNRAELWLRVRNLLRLKALGDFARSHDAQVTRELRESEQRLRTIIETEPECVKVVNKEMVLVDMNAAGLAMLEADSLAAAQAQPLSDFIVPEYRAAFAELHARVMRGESGKLEYELIGLKGGRRWLESHAAPLNGTNGNASMLLGVTRDITARKHGDEALSRFSTAMDATADAIYLVDRASMQFVHVNDAACRMQSRTRAEMLVLGPAGVLGITRAELERTYDDIIASGTDAVPVEMLRSRGDGAQAWVELRRHAQRSGDRWTIVTLVRDITERKLAAQEFLESERRFSDLLRHVQLASVMLDREARITYCNEYLLQLTGWRLDEVVGRSWVELFIPPESGDLKERLAALLAGTPEARHGENKIITRSGEHRLMRWNNSVLRSGTGEITGTASIGEDITERKAADEVLQKRTEELERFHRLSVGREMQMIELKKEINESAKLAGRSLPYDLSRLELPAVPTGRGHE